MASDSDYGAVDRSEALALYLRELEKIEPLTNEEEEELFQEMRHSPTDERRERATKQLLENRLLLVTRIAQKFSFTGISMLDLIQEGNLGLLQAVKTFPGTSVGSFSEYASEHIENAIAKFVDNSK